MQRAFVALACTAVVTGAASGEPPVAPYSVMIQAWARGDLDRALAAADAVAAARPPRAAQLVGVGALYCEMARNARIFARLSWARKCRTTWERASAVDPSNTQARFNLVDFYARAPLIAGGSVEKAKAQAAILAAQDPVLGEIALGFVARAQKQPTEAERRFRRATEIDTTGVKGIGALVDFLVAQRRWTDATALFESRLATWPDDRFAAYQLARVLHAEGGSNARALQLMDRCLSGPVLPDAPSLVDAWHRKALILSSLGRRAEAISALEKAVALNPDHLGAARELARLRR